MNFVKISNIVCTKEGAIIFLREHDIIPKEKVCSCGHAMILSLGLKTDGAVIKRDAWRQFISRKILTYLENCFSTIVSLGK